LPKTDRYLDYCVQHGPQHHIMPADRSLSATLNTNLKKN
jgi:hypothetical protein